MVRVSSVRIPSWVGAGPPDFCRLEVRFETAKNRRPMNFFAGSGDTLPGLRRRPRLLRRGTWRFRS